MQEAAAKYTVREYFDLYDLGLIAPDERTELLGGLVVSMAPQAPKHASVVSRLQQILHASLPPTAFPRVQLPLVLGEYSVPEPDIAVVTAREDFYAEEHPHTALLVIEVAESSVGQDRLTKSRIYAAAGLPHYWIVNLRDRVVEVFGDPDTEARLYRSRTEHRFGALTCPALPGLAIEATTLLGSPVS